MSQRNAHPGLAARGLSTRPADHGQKDIVNRAGVLLFTGQGPRGLGVDEEVRRDRADGAIRRQEVMSDSPLFSYGMAFIREDKRLGYGDEREVLVGETLSCHLLSWNARDRALNPQVQARSRNIRHGGKDRSRGIQSHPAKRSDMLRSFARQYALSVAHLWEMPDIVRRYLESGDESIRGRRGRHRRRAAAGDAAGRRQGTPLDAARVAGRGRLDAAGVARRGRGRRQVAGRDALDAARAAGQGRLGRRLEGRLDAALAHRAGRRLGAARDAARVAAPGRRQGRRRVRRPGRRQAAALDALDALAAARTPPRAATAEANQPIRVHVP